MIDFSYYWLFIAIYVLVLPLSLAFGFTYAFMRNIKYSMIWSLRGLMGSLLISLEFNLAESIMMSIPGSNSPGFLTAFIGILAGMLGLGFAMGVSFFKRTSAAKLETAVIGK